jgi:hypothetical protein
MREMPENVHFTVALRLAFREKLGNPSGPLVGRMNIVAKRILRIRRFIGLATVVFLNSRY